MEETITVIMQSNLSRHQLISESRFFIFFSVLLNEMFFIEVFFSTPFFPLLNTSGQPDLTMLGTCAKATPSHSFGRLYNVCYSLTEKRSYESAAKTFLRLTQSDFKGQIIFYSNFYNETLCCDFSCVTLCKTFRPGS